MSTGRRCARPGPGRQPLPAPPSASQWPCWSRLQARPDHTAAFRNGPFQRPIPHLENAVHCCQIVCSSSLPPRAALNSMPCASSPQAHALTGIIVPHSRVSSLAGLPPAHFFAPDFRIRLSRHFSRLFRQAWPGHARFATQPAATEWRRRNCRRRPAPCTFAPRALSRYEGAKVPDTCRSQPLAMVKSGSASFLTPGRRSG